MYSKQIHFVFSLSSMAYLFLSVWEYPYDMLQDSVAIDMIIRRMFIHSEEYIPYQ